MNIQFVTFSKFFSDKTTKLAFVRESGLGVIFSTRLSTWRRLLLRTFIGRSLLPFLDWGRRDSLYLAFKWRLYILRFRNSLLEIRCPSKLTTSSICISFIGCPYLILIHLQIRLNLWHYFDQALQYLDRLLGNKVVDLIKPLFLI